MSNNKINLIGIYSEQCSLKSDYVPLISFKNQKQKEVVEKYILQEVELFFDKLSIKFNDVTLLPYSQSITEIDFKSIDISYFYENLFYDLGERSFDNKLKIKLKWCLTFDEGCTPIRLLKSSANSTVDRKEINFYGSKHESCFYRRFGTIDINGTPVVYYIHFTIQEILDVIKQIPVSESLHYSNS